MIGDRTQVKRIERCTCACVLIDCTALRSLARPALCVSRTADGLVASATSPRREQRRPTTI